MKSARWRLAVLILLGGWAPLAWAESITERLATCYACHGEQGQSFNPDTPSLGAQPSPYLLIQLYLFREKLRDVELMNAAVKGFTDDDLRIFADTLAKLPPPPATAGPIDPARLDRGRALAHQHRCNVCHLPDLAGRGVFKRWVDDPSEFAQVAVDRESGTIVWPGGLDVAPDRLYSDIARSGKNASSRSRVP